MKIKRNIALISALILMAVYFYLFFQRGILLENTFLRLSREDNAYVFKGSSRGKDIIVRVDGDVYITNTAVVSYEIENEYRQNFVINATSPLEYSTFVKIYVNDKVKFEGTYKIDSRSFFPLSDKYGKPYMDDLRISFEGYNVENSYTKPFEASYTHIVTTAFKDNIIIRGNWELMLTAVLLLIFIAVDIKWPLFFFLLSYHLSVKDPEPSELYISIQHISWIVIPIISLVLLIAGILTH